MQAWVFSGNTNPICSHLRWSLKLASFPFALNFRCCQVVPGSKCSWDVWSPELNVLVTQALFSFITWHLLLKGRSKGEIQGSHGECWKKGTLRTDLLAKKDSDKRTLCVAFWECFQCPKPWRVCKMHMPWWKRWPKLHSHSCTRPLHVPLKLEKFL